VLALDGTTAFEGLGFGLEPTEGIEDSERFGSTEFDFTDLKGGSGLREEERVRDDKDSKNIPVTIIVFFPIKDRETEQASMENNSRLLQSVLLCLYNKSTHTTSRCMILVSNTYTASRAGGESSSRSSKESSDCELHDECMYVWI
jgi:hypothetical protein